MSLDMSDIVSDPDLQSNLPLQCMRRPVTVTDGGLTQYGAQPFTIYAVVVPANGRQLNRLADMDRTSAGIAVYTTANLICEAPGYGPDIITWKGQPYLCAFVDDFSTNGFNGVVASLTQVTGPLPAALPN